MAPEVQLNLLIAASAIVVVYCYLLSVKLGEANRKMDCLFEQFNGLRVYLYSIDPQFDDERVSRAEMDEGADIYAGYSDLKLLQAKETEGRRTLNTPFA